MRTIKYDTIQFFDGILKSINLNIFYDIIIIICFTQF